MNYSQWKQKLQETIGTYAIVSKRPKDGDGFNVWGALGKKGGVSITGEADTAETDPTGEKGNRSGTRKGKRSK
jgi:hypothetical protein